MPPPPPTAAGPNGKARSPESGKNGAARWDESASNSVLSETMRYSGVPHDPSVNGSGDSENEGDMQDNINARVEQLFPTFTTSEFLLPEEMLELLSDLELEVTMAALQAYCDDEQIDLETAQEIAQHFFVALRNVQLNQNESTAVVHQGVWDFFKTTLLCRRAPGTEYRLVPPKLDLQLSPRTILLSGTVVVMFLIGMLVIATVALLWVRTETERELRVSASLGETVLSFASLFEQNWLLIAGQEAASETDVFAQYAERNSIMKERKKLQREEELARTTVGSYERAFGEGVLRADHVYAAAKLRLLRETVKLLAARWPPEEERTALRAKVVGIVKGWETQSWDAIITRRSASPLEVLEQPRAPCTPEESGCSYNIPCLSQATINVSMLNETIGVRNEAAQAASVLIAEFDIAICLLVQQRDMRSSANSYMATTKDAVAVALLPFGIEVSLVTAQEGNTMNAPQLNWSTTHTLFEPAECYTAAASSDSCRELDSIVGNAIVRRRVNTTLAMGRHGKPLLCTIAPTVHESAMTMCSSRAAHISEMVSEKIAIINHLNFNFERTTEIVASTIDRATGIITPQASEFRFEDECYERCFRSPPSAATAISAFETMRSGYGITPDYRPEPVIGGYSYSPYLDIAVLIERDVEEIRTTSSETLVAILDMINVEVRDAEIVALRPAGHPPTKTFDPFAPCPGGVTCFTADGFGIVFRSDCVHCQRLLDRSISSLDVLTTLKSSSECALLQGQARANCSSVLIGRFAMYNDPFALRDTPEDARSHDASVVTGYTGESFLAGRFHVDNISMGLVLQWPVATYQRPILVVVGLSIGAACIFVITALVILMLQSRRYLDDIEDEWSAYKGQISEENDKFAETVIEVLPARIAQRILKKQAVVAETHSLTFMFISFASFQRFIAGWEPQLLNQYASYCFYLITTVAQHYKIHKVRTIGDMAFVVGGIQDERDGESMSRATLRVVQAASVILQLTSFLYTHSPPKVAALKKVATTEKITDICNFRVGVHFGPCTLHVCQTGGTPTFDCVGTNVSMAWKLHQLAKASTINISAAVKEAIERREALKSFIFDKPRNVMHKKQVIQALLVTHAQVQVPPSVVHALAIRRSHPRLYYVDGGFAYVCDGKRIRSSAAMTSSSLKDQSEHAISEKSE